MDFKDKRVLVIGLARSGMAVARALTEKGAKVTAADIKDRNKVAREVLELERAGIITITGGYPTVKKGQYDVIIPSPGVPLSIPPLQAALAQGIPVWSEIELASRLIKGILVAVTGTNGKTTTTALIGQVFKDFGVPVVVAGNIGIPLVQEADNITPQHVAVVEVSSFQLETTVSFCPHIAVILNLTPDHLDRHKTFEHYVQAKARIFRNQDQNDYTILNYDDPEVRKLAEQTPGRVIFFSCEHILKEGVYLHNQEIVVKHDRLDQSVCPAASVAIKGKHNLENAMAAVASAIVLGVSPQSVAHTLATFPGVAHRLELVREINGVQFINDSKGTNPDASIKALEAYDRPIVLIAGGYNKGSEFSHLAQVIKRKVKSLVLIGETAHKLAQAVTEVGFTDFYYAADFPEAVNKAYGLAQPGQIVLLSPACASWDMFDNYEQRGEKFKELVHELAKNR